jgi:hypothetical protein
MLKESKSERLKKIPKLFQRPEPGPVTVSAQKLLGITVGCSKINTRTRQRGEELYAVIYSGDNIPRAIAVHTTDMNLQPFPLEYVEDGQTVEVSMPRLFKLWMETPEATLMLAAYLTNHKPFSDHVKQLASTVNEPYASFLDAVESYGNPSRSIGETITRALFIWAPAQDMIPNDPNEETASLHGRIVRYYEAGDAIRKAILRLPPRFKKLRPDPVTRVLDHCAYACPRHLVTHGDYISVGRKAYAYFLGELNQENISSLMAQNLDILIQMRLVGRYYYLTTVIRAEVDKNNLAGLNEVGEMLQANYGKWDRLEGPDVLTAFRAYIPGSAPVPENWFYTHLDRKTYRPILASLSKSLNPVSDGNGVNAIGKVGRQTFVVDPKENPARLFTGTSKIAGKTTIAAFDALQYLPPIWFPLTREIGGSHTMWGENFSQTPSIDWNTELIKENLITPGPEKSLKRVIELRLPDAPTLIEAQSRDNGRTRITDNEKIRELQEKLHGQDRKLAERIVQKVFDKWSQYGTSVGLPLTFRIMTGNSTRVLNFYDTFLGIFREAHEGWFQKSGLFNLLVFDNFSTLNEVIRRGPDMHLGRLSVDVAINLAARIGWLLSNGANIGLLTWVLTHNETDLDIISKGIYSHFGLHIKIKDKNQNAQVISPSSQEIITDKLNVWLPPHFVNVVGRNEPGTDNGNVPLEEESVVEKQVSPT